MLLSNFIVVFSLSFNLLITAVVSYKSFLQDASELMVQNLIDKYKNPDHTQFWHHHVSETEENREVVKIANVEKFSLHGDYVQWEHTRLGLHHYLLGLSNSTVDIYNAVDLKKLHSIHGTETLVAFTAFTKWDEDSNSSEMIIAIVTVNPGLIIFRATHKQVNQIGYWPLNYQVKEIKRCLALMHTRLLLIPKLAHVPLELYNLETSQNKSKFWFFQRIEDYGQQSATCYDLIPMQSVIAVASHTINLINVYTYDSSTGYNHHQDIKVENKCLELISFSLSYKHYLGCIPDSRHNIEFFSQSGTLYFKANFLGDHSAVSVYAAQMENYRDEPMLFIRDIHGDTHILHYDGISHTFRSGYDCKHVVSCLPVVQLSKGASFQNHQGTTIYISPSEKLSRNCTILLIRTKIEYGIHSPVYRQSRQLYKLFETEHNRFSEWQKAISEATNVLENSLSFEGENIVTGPWTLTNTLSGGHLTLLGEHEEHAHKKDLGHPNPVQQFVFVNQNWTKKDFDATKQFEEVDTDFKKFGHSLGEAKHIMSDAVLRNCSELQIVQKPTFVKSHFQSTEFHATNAWIDRLWGIESTTQFMNNLYLRDSPTPQEIKGTLVFGKSLSMYSMHVDYFNGVQLENVARLSADNVFKCPIEFMKKFTATGDIHASTVGGYNLTEDLVMINDIRDCIFMDGLEARKTTIQDLNFNFDNILLKTKSQEVKSHIIFEEIRTKSDISVEKVNGVPFNAFAEEIVLRNYDGSIRGTTKILGKLNCTKIGGINKLNSVPFPDGYIRNNQPVVHITGAKDFAHISADKVYVNGRLNGIFVDKMWIGLSNPMKINSTWIFKNNVQIIGNMNVTGKVNGISMDDIRHHEIFDKRKDGYVIHADVEFTKPIIFNNLYVQSKINDKSHQEMFDGVLIFDDKKECHISGETEFADSLRLHNLHILTGEINKTPLNSLMTLNTPQNISGHITLAKESFFNDLHTEIFDFIPLSTFFDKTIRLSNPGIIESNLNFANLVVDGKFSTGTGLINGYNTFSTLVAVTEGRTSQVFHADKYVFDHLISEELEVTHRLNTAKGKTIGGVDLMDWYSSRVRLDKDARISSPVIFHGVGRAMKDINTEMINNVLLEDLAHGALRNDKNLHVFEEPLHIKNLHVKGEVVWKEKVNGYSLEEVKRHALPLNSNELHVINYDWEFESINITGNLHVHGNTCGANIPFLQKDIVKKGEQHITVSGDKSFESTVNVKHSLDTHSLNGDANFFNDIISLHDSHLILDHVHFRKNLIVDEMLKMDSLNDISMTRLCHAYSFDNGNTHVLRNNLEVTGDLIGHNLEVHGLYQDVNVSHLFSDIVKTHGGPIYIRGPKVFSEPVYVKEQFFAEKINGVDILKLDKNVIKTNRPHTFYEPVVFNNIQTLNVIVNGSDFESKQLPNNANLHYLSQHAVYINGHENEDSSLNLHFHSISIENDFHVNNINGRPIGNYIKLNDSDQRISKLTVENVKFSGPNVFVRDFVGGLNISKEYANTLMNDSPIPQHVKGQKYFTKPINVNGNLVCENEKWPKTTEDVVTIDEDHTIYGPVVFQKPVHIKNMVASGKVSGRSMKEYLSDPLTYDGNQEIPATWTFNGGATFEHGVIGDGKFDGYDIRNIVEEIKRNVSVVEKHVEEDLQAFHEQCLALDAITKRLTETSLKLDYFDMHQNIMLGKQVNMVSTVQTEGKLILLMFLEQCQVYKYIWEDNQGLFTELLSSNIMEPKLGHVKTVQTFSWNRLGLLLYSTQQSDCVAIPPGLFITGINGGGNFSTPYLVYNSSVVDFKLIKTQGKYYMMAITNKATNMGQELIVFSWHSTGKFVAEQFLYFKGPLLQLEITEFQQGIAFLLQTRYAIFSYHYDIGTKVVSLIGLAEFSVKPHSSMVLFNNYGALYIIVQKYGSDQSLINPTCSLQVFRIHDGKTQRLQDIPAGDVVSTNLLQVSGNEFLISVIPKRAPVVFYKFMGLSGLQSFYSHPIKIYDAKQIHFFNAKPFMKKSQRPFFALLAKNSVTIYHSSVFGSKMEKNYAEFSDICSLY